MPTVTGMTADRMLAIEAASVTDGDVDANGNLILTKHDGSQINAGSVIGPPGPQGPVGSFLPVVTAQPVLDVGIINQIRAGRQLSPADFGNMGLSAPLGLWNLSDLSDASGNGRNLQNKGAVPFAVGINGGANTAAQFSGNVAQALYIPDAGAGDPLRIGTGSAGGWSRTAKQATYQYVITKSGSGAANAAFELGINSGNLAVFNLYIGANANTVVGLSNPCDDRWHFIVGTFDGSTIRLYVDGILEGVLTATGLMNQVATTLNIGTANASAGVNGASPHFGRVDEAFITSDVLSEDQIRNLYCAKIPHANGSTPARFNLNVRRRRRGAALASSDFPTAPLRLYNFSAGSLGDEGSNGAALTNNSSCPIVAGADGAAGNAFHFGGGAQNLTATDTGLPSGVNPYSYGYWIKMQTAASNPSPGGWSGTYHWVGGGYLTSRSLGDDINTNFFVNDGQWHFIVSTGENTPIDGIKRKCYVDGQLVGISTTLGANTLSGANGFILGNNVVGGNLNFVGEIDGAFVCGYVLTSDQIRLLYAKSLLALTPSPKNVGDHIEGADANNLYAIFDTLDTNAQVDLKVAT
jgi:hypothetical protein